MHDLDPEERVRSRTYVAEGLQKGANSFGLIRVIFALSVILSHAWPIGGFGVEPLTRLSGGISLGTVAVSGFFALSGMLITISAEGPSSGAFTRRRVARIMPGYWMALVVGGFVIGTLICLVRGLDVRAALTTPQEASVRSYIVNNLFLGQNQFELGSALKGMPYPAAINGSLWSLVYEFTCYFLVLAVVRWYIGARRDWRVLALVGALSVLAATLSRSGSFTPIGLPLLGSLDPGQFYNLWSAFFAGAVLALFRDQVPLSIPLAVVSWSWVIVSLPLHLFWPLGVLAFPYALIALAYYLPEPFRVVGSRNDLSYGLYLYGFPVLQLVVALNWARAGAIWTFVVASLITICFAAFSWFGLERHFVGSRREVAVRAGKSPLRSERGATPASRTGGRTASALADESPP